MCVSCSAENDTRLLLLLLLLLIPQAIHSLATASSTLDAHSATQLGTSFTVVVAGNVSDSGSSAYAVPCSLVNGDPNAQACISLTGATPLPPGSNIIASMQECTEEYYVHYKPSPTSEDGFMDVSVTMVCTLCPIHVPACLTHIPVRCADRV